MVFYFCCYFSFFVRVFVIFFFGLFTSCVWLYLFNYCCFFSCLFFPFILSVIFSVNQLASETVTHLSSLQVSQTKQWNSNSIRHVLSCSINQSSKHLITHPFTLATSLPLNEAVTLSASYSPCQSFTNPQAVSQSGTHPSTQASFPPRVPPHHHPARQQEALAPHANQYSVFYSRFPILMFGIPRATQHSASQHTDNTRTLNSLCDRCFLLLLFFFSHISTFLRVAPAVIFSFAFMLGLPLSRAGDILACVWRMVLVLCYSKATHAGRGSWV